MGEGHGDREAGYLFQLAGTIQAADHGGHGADESLRDVERAWTDLFARTWDPVVLPALRIGPRRRRELRVAIGGLSDKALTEALARLLGNGLIERWRFGEAPRAIVKTCGYRGLRRAVRVVR